MEAVQAYRVAGLPQLLELLVDPVEAALRQILVGHQHDGAARAKEQRGRRLQERGYEPAGGRQPVHVPGRAQARAVAPSRGIDGVVIRHHDVGRGRWRGDLGNGSRGQAIVLADEGGERAAAAFERLVEAPGGSSPERRPQQVQAPVLRRLTQRNPWERTFGDEQELDGPGWPPLPRLANSALGDRVG